MLAHHRQTFFTLLDLMLKRQGWCHSTSTITVNKFHKYVPTASLWNSPGEMDAILPKRLSTHLVLCRCRLEHTRPEKAIAYDSYHFHTHQTIQWPLWMGALWCRFSAHFHGHPSVYCFRFFSILLISFFFCKRCSNRNRFVEVKLIWCSSEYVGKQDHTSRWRFQFVCLFVCLLAGFTQIAMDGFSWKCCQWQVSAMVHRWSHFGRIFHRCGTWYFESYLRTWHFASYLHKYFIICRSDGDGNASFGWNSTYSRADDWLLRLWIQYLQ